MAANRKKDQDVTTSGDENPGAYIVARAEISEEERREILDQIDGIAEKNRQSLSADPAKNFKAKRNGGLFPILVNVFAAVMLAGGFFALYAFQSDIEVQAREGTRVFNPAERTLIDEIRRETVASLAERDREINTILSSLSDVENQLQELSSNGDALTPEQLADQERLRVQREERRAALALAREERSRILDDARTDEADLQLRRDMRERERAALSAEEEAERQARREERRRERAAQAAETDTERTGRRAGADTAIARGESAGQRSERATPQGRRANAETATARGEPTEPRTGRAAPQDRRASADTPAARSEPAEQRTERSEPRGQGRGRTAAEERRAAEARAAEEAELQALRKARRAARAERAADNARAESGEDRRSERGRNREHDVTGDSDDARTELAAARREQRRADAEEDQLAGLATRAGRRIANSENLDEAEEAIESLRYALDATAFQGRDGRARRDIAQVADTLETVVREERRGGAARQRMVEIEEQVGVLQEVLGMGGYVPSDDLLERVKFLTSLLDDSEIRQVVRERLQVGQHD